MYTNGAIVVLAVAFSSTLQLSSARSLPRRDLPVTANDTKVQENSENSNSTTNSTGYSNKNSYQNATRGWTYPNGTQRYANAPAPSYYSAKSPPPDLLDLPLFTAMPSSFPLANSKGNCTIEKKNEGMSVSLPMDMYAGGKSKCGHRVVVMFEPPSGKSWTGARNNLTLRVVDAFDNDNQTEIGGTLLLSEKAWKEATGNEVINPFESWPVRWFFLDPEMQSNATKTFGDTSSDDDSYDSSDNSTTYDESSGSSGTDSGNSTDGHARWSNNSDNQTESASNYQAQPSSTTSDDSETQDYQSAGIQRDSMNVPSDSPDNSTTWDNSSTTWDNSSTTRDNSSTTWDNSSGSNGTASSNSSSSKDSNVYHARWFNKSQGGGNQSESASDSQHQAPPAVKRNNVPVPEASWSKIVNKRNLRSRRSSKPFVTTTNLFP